MTPQEFIDGVGAYVLGALDPEEKKAFDEFLESGRADAACKAAYQEALETAEALNNSLPPVKPPPHVWDAIETDVTLAPTRDSGADDASFAPVLRQAVPWAIAASLLLVTFLTQMQMRNTIDRVSALEERETALNIQLTSLRQDANYMMAMLDKPGTKLVSMDQTVEGTHRAAMLMHSGDKECMVVGTGWKKLDDAYYTLWFISTDGPKNIGVLEVDENGTGMVKIPWSMMADHPDKIAITIEKDPHVSKPDGQVVSLGPL